jgi:hypothetical protein
MLNDPFPCFEHLTQGQLGELFGVTSHRIGRWLIEVGLRGLDKQPTRQAVEGGSVKTVCIEDGPRFPVWNKEQTVRFLERAGHRRLGSEQGTMAEQFPGPLGPFVSRSSGDGGDGYEIVGADGTVAVWCRGGHLADRLAWLLTLADKHGRLG